MLAALLSNGGAKPDSSHKSELSEKKYAASSTASNSSPAAATKTADGMDRPSNAQEMDAFAESWTKLEGTQARLEAVVAWVGSFGSEDYVKFVNMMVGYDEDDAAEMSESVEALTDWMFGDNEAIGMILFERWAKVAP